MQNTVVVTVHRYVMHPMYAKRFRVSKKFLADTNDQKNIGVGDEVVITECRPISKRKCFRITEVRKRAVRVGELKLEEIEQQTKRDHRDTFAEKKRKDSVATPS
jgi:small subunit ribosomal protein S17